MEAGVKVKKKSKRHSTKSSSQEVTATSPVGPIPEALTCEQFPEVFSQLNLDEGGESINLNSVSSENSAENVQENGNVSINEDNLVVVGEIEAEEAPVDVPKCVGDSSNETDNISSVEQPSRLKSDETDQSSCPSVEAVVPSVPLLYPALEEIECTEAVEINFGNVNINELDETVDPCEEAIPTAPAKTESGVFFSLVPGQISDHSVSRIGEVAEDVTRTTSVELTNILQRIRSPQCRVSQISALYNNLFIENSDVDVKEFLNTTKTAYDGYELYELLCNYQRAFNQLGVCEKSLYELREQFSELEKVVWAIKSETVREESTCKDENTVEATHQYHTATFKQEVFTQLERSLKQVKELTKDSFPLYTYSVQLCRTQIDHFFHKNFSHINLQSFEIQGYHGDYPNAEIESSANNLRMAISTLFIFARKATLHPSFLEDCKRWLSNCVGLLLRIATLRDHLFILNHVLRIPPGHVNKWACCFVQIPKIPIPNHPSEFFGTFSHIYLDYALASLNLILKPVSKREDFLKYHDTPYKVVGPNDSSHQWVVIDSDGEDDPEDATFFKESDLIALLHQIPFDRIFKRILFVYESQGIDIYDIQNVNENNVLKLIEFMRQLVTTLGHGFTSYYTDRYRQLTKLLGRLILHATKYVTEHVENFLNRDDTFSRRELIVNSEYDLFLMNSVSVLLSGRNIGTLQFLAATPFHLVSSDILWDCYALITKWASSEKNGLASEDISYEFENDLVSMNESDAFYLLNTLSNMAIAREGKEPDFVRIVTFHLFQIGFLSPVTRDACSKHARDLLGALTKKYPYLISVLLDVVKTKMDILDSLSLYLMKELAFDVWKPTILDLKLLSHWLLNYTVVAIESQTSRFVIQSMNFGFDEKGELFLPYEVHLKIGLLVFEAHSRWVKNQSLLSESMKQVSSLAGKSQDNYGAWAWDLVMKLHLHIYDRSNNGIRLATLLRTLPTFESHPELENLRMGLSEKNPLACLLSLLITPLGHSIPVVCPHGIEQLEVMILNSKYEAVLHALFFLTPLFVSCREALFRNEKFRGILTSVLAADMTYMRMAKSLIKYDFPGYYTKMFGDMVSTQIQQSFRFQTSATALIKLWIDCITKLENWNKDRNALHVLDVIAKYCFTKEEWHNCFMDHFIAVYKELSATTQSGIASFLFSWSSSAKTLLPTPFYSSSPYFTFGLLTIETTLENETGFWNSVMVSLANPKTSLDAAVKKACNTSKLTTSVSFLTIYRWAQFALELPVDHELAFLVWQKFFSRYLFRPVTGDSNQGVGVGDRFFDGMVNTAFAKRLKARLFETLEYYRNALGAVEVSAVEENASENPAIMMDYYKECVSVATAFTLWIDDPKMHSASLYLPALPPQFLPLRLLSVMEGCHIEWKEFVNNEDIEASVKNVALNYAALIGRSSWYEDIRRRRNQSVSTYDDRQDEILRRLATYDQPLEPPSAPTFDRILPIVPGIMLVEPKSMFQGISPHFKNLTDYAQCFSMQISQQTALDCCFCENLPELYNNFPAEVMVNVRCSGTKKWGSCNGPAHVLFKFTEARLNESVGRRIHQNRTDYENLMNEKLLQPPPMQVCVAAVLLEDFITTLVVNFRTLPESHPEHARTSAVGAELFYQLIELINDDTNFYPPTRQLFTSSAEVLGREFISPDASQYKRLVNICTLKPHLIGVLAPNINLAMCSTSNLIEIYKDVTNIPKKDADLAFVILTKFDITSWLWKTKPKLFERSQLISYIWKAVTSEGFDPEQCSMVYDVFRHHFKAILMFDFPQHYGEILNYLLEGSEAQIVPIIIWFDFFNCLSRNVIKFKSGMDSAVKRREIKRFSTEANIIHHKELIETARLLARHFTKERLSYGIYGLYPKYRNYIEAFSCFMQLISVSLVASTLKNSKGSLSQKIVESIWPVLHDLYAPWILPYNQKTIQQQCAQWIQQMNFDSSSVLHPWVANDSSLAIIFMNDFTDCLMFLVETLPGTGSLFSCLWGFYVENYANSGVKPHVLGVVHNCLVSVPWTIFWPNFQDVETMNRVVEKYLPSCHSFLAVIFAQVNWLEWIKHLNPSTLSKGYGIVLNLTVRLANDSIARESPSWVCVMERALYQMTWENISPAILEPILNWFVMSIDPRVVLQLENGHHMDRAVLKLLKLASGFIIADIPPPSNSTGRSGRIDVPHKRYLFVRSYIRLLVTASSKYKQMLGTHSKNFEESITLLMDDVVAVVRSENTQTEEFLPQLQELVALMSNHYLGTIARNALIEWCNCRRDAPLPVLYTLVQLSFSAKVPAYVVVPLVETVMNLCFAHPGATWANLCERATLTPDEREVANYFEVSSKDGHFLVLYILLMKRYRLISNGGVNSINFLSDILKNLKPRESNEEAMPLIYGNMIKCILHILQSETPSKQNSDTLSKCAKKFMTALSQHLSLYADDKQSWGLLGALGLGKASQLTVKGRLFVRCLGVFILAQIPANSDIRIQGCTPKDNIDSSSESSSSSSSPTKPHSEYASSMEKLVGLKTNRQYASLEDIIDFAIEFTENSSNSLGNVDIFIKQLNGFLFTGRYLFDS